MPIIDKPISEAEYYSQRDYGQTISEKKTRAEILRLQRKGLSEKEILKKLNNRQEVAQYLASKDSGIQPGQALYLEVGKSGVKDEILTAPNKNAKTGLTIDSKEFFSRPKTVDVRPGQPLYTEITNKGVRDNILYDTDTKARTGYTLQEDLRDSPTNTQRELPLSRKERILGRIGSAYRDVKKAE
jgi:hypothetical protein